MAPLQIYELFDYKYILKYIFFLKKHKKMCTKIYKKMPCKKLQIPPGPSVDHIYAWQCHFANVSDWNLKPCCGFRRKGQWQDAHLFIFFFFFSFLISETSEFVEPRGLYKPQRQSQKPNSSKQVLRLKISFDSAKTSLSTEGGDMISHPPGQGQPHSGGGRRRFSQRA